MAPARHHPQRHDLDYMAFVEACYRIEQSEQDWLIGVADAAAALMGGDGGVHACLVDLRSAQPLTLPVYVHGSAAWEAEWRSTWWQPFMARLRAEDVKLLHALRSVSYTSDLWSADPAANPSFRDELPGAIQNRFVRSDASPRGPSGFRYPDSLNVFGLDAAGRGALLVANMSEVATGPLHPSDVTLWRRLAVHVAAGHRLLRSRPREPDVVITPCGRVAHQSGRDEVALAWLRERVVAIDRARAGQRDDWRASTSAWTGLVDGRWSLVDSFERDGRRYYLAHANMPVVRHDALTDREAQVAHAAALGHANKLIAYALGISASTVASHIKSAAQKLGVRTRLELIRHLRSTPD